jgi:hypothetical protein
METNSNAVASRQFPGRHYAWLGVAAVVLGPVLYSIQMTARILTVVPWYAPILATVGLGLSIFALGQARSAWRFIGLGFCFLLAAFQWFIVLPSKLPEYSGPATVGKPLPEFSATRADGTPFESDDLAGEQNTVMVFFRGRW